MKTIYSLLLMLCCIFGMFTHRVSAITIVSQGKSTFTIVLPDKAPASVKDAALELQQDIAESTSVTLPIKKDSEVIVGNFISLGSTKQAASVGITIDGIDDGGFRIRTQQNNIYILGPDTVALIHSSKRLDYSEYQEQPDIPGPQLTQDGGFSNGTANGVYTFLEDYLGVRWLMPGDLGRDVPVKSTFAVPDIDRTQAPLFIYRLLALVSPYRQVTPAVEQWGIRQKLGFSFRLNHDHNWVQTVPQKLYKDHPDWFAMIDGKRIPPATTWPASSYYKVETTNSGLIQYFADKAVAALKADPHLNSFSLSPSDGRGWSESPESKAFYDPPPPGSKFPSVTPLILKWYKDVSDIVAKEDPSAKLAGYLYVDFSTPPQKGSMKLPENFVPVIVGRGFGYRFYRKEVREEGANLMQEWAKVAPSTWFYYGMPLWLRNSSGMLTTASPDNLNFLFSLLRKNHIKGAYLYGTPTWSQTAMANYVEAKMLWDPTLDAHDLQRDWLTHAYGAEAGKVMGELYKKMDNGAFADYFRQDPSQHYNVREKMFKEYYAPQYPEIEKYFLQAKSQPMTALQKQRLQLIEDNLIVLQWRLRNAGYLPADFKSSLRRTDKQVVDLLLAKHKDFDYFPGTVYKSGVGKTKVQLAQSPNAPATVSPPPKSNMILLYSSQEGNIQFTFSDVHPGSSFVSYLINDAATGREVQSGLLYSGETISMKAAPNAAYYLSIRSNGIISPKFEWSLSIKDATLANADFRDGVVYLYAPTAAVNVYVPPKLSLTVHQLDSGVTLGTQAKQQLAKKVLWEKYPDAKIVQQLNDNWRFNTDPQKTGVSQNFMHPDYNAQSWKTLSAMDTWQNQGFPNYHGTAWYRKTFEAPNLGAADPQGVEKQILSLGFGAIDGDAVIYLNGEKVGEHLLLKGGTGWDQPFKVNVTNILKPGQNTIAVQVTKDRYASGIYRGVSLLLEESATD